MNQVGEYKGHPTLSLNAETKHPFTFGVAKARAILENLQAIREFVDHEDETASDREIDDPRASSFAPSIDARIGL